MVWVVSVLSLISSSFSLVYSQLRTVPKASATIFITVTLEHKSNGKLGFPNTFNKQRICQKCIFLIVSAKVKIKCIEKNMNGDYIIDMKSWSELNAFTPVEK